jgi:hydrogenase 3 maturation protease
MADKSAAGDWLRGKLVIVGIGHILRGDDGVGPALIARLQGTVDAVCIDAGNAPENYLGRIAREKPDTVLLVDAADLALPPGQYRILRRADIARHGLTTHDISAGLLIEFLAEQTSADIYMLALQPQHMTLGEPMSRCLRETLDHVEQWIRQMIGQGQQQSELQIN